MKKKEVVQQKKSKFLAVGFFVLGITFLWALLNWSQLSMRLSLPFTRGAGTTAQSAVISEMKSRNPEYSIDKEPLVLQGPVTGLTETYATDLFSVLYPEGTYAYNANTSDLSGFGFCPGGQGDCQYPKMVVIPMKTTSLMEWLEQDAEYHEKAYWNYTTQPGIYQIVVRPLQLNNYQGVFLEVTCKPGNECAAQDAAMGAFDANGRIYVFQYDLGDDTYKQILQGFTLQQ